MSAHTCEFQRTRDASSSARQGTSAANHAPLLSREPHTPASTRFNRPRRSAISRGQGAVARLEERDFLARSLEQVHVQLARAGRLLAALDCFSRAAARRRPRRAGSTAQRQVEGVVLAATRRRAHGRVPLQRLSRRTARAALRARSTSSRGRRESVGRSRATESAGAGAARRHGAAQQRRSRGGKK